MKYLIPLLSSAFLIGAELSPLPYSQDDQKIAVQNSILCKVNGKTISMMDVKKKMDLAFHQNYPQLSQSSGARLQFYEMSWRPLLREMVDQELIISDALDKEIKITDGEIREAVEERFGPNVMQTLDGIGLTYDEGLKMIKDELIVQRMNWWFIHSQAVQTVTPQDIRQAYRLYLEEHPPYANWKYRVISIRTNQANDFLSQEIFDMLSMSGESPEQMEAALKEKEIAGVSISLSNEFVAKTDELSEPHLISLAPLTPGSYSKPSFQVSRVDKKTVYRIFYLIEKTEHPAPSFEELASQLKNDLTQKAIAKQSDIYRTKLRKHYGFDNLEVENALPEDFHPFSLQ